MAITRTFVVTALLLLLGFAARAQDAVQLPPTVPDMVYKGIVGKALDAVPMDPEKRVVLQRTNAVVSNTLTGRSLAAWAGLSNPILLVAGVAWGIYSAMNIKAVPAYAKPDVIDGAPGSVQVALVRTQPVAVDAEYAECVADAATTEVTVVTEVDTYGEHSSSERIAATLQCGRHHIAALLITSLPPRADLHGTLSKR